MVEENKNSKKKLIIIICSIIAAVTVILFVVIFIVIPSIQEKNKKDFKNDGLEFYNGAKNAYNDIIKNSSGRYNLETSMCISSDYLNNSGYFTKGRKLGYYGSFLASYNSKTGETTYVYWLTDGKRFFSEVTEKETITKNIKNYDMGDYESVMNCPLSNAKFTPSRDSNYVTCSNEGCHMDIAPTQEYYCSEGIDNGKGCTVTSYTTCQDGYVLEGNECIKKSTPIYQCNDENYILSGSICYIYKDADAICPSGYKITDRDNNECSKEETAKFACPEGYTASGNTCFKYITFEKDEHAKCPSGYNEIKKTQCQKEITIEGTYYCEKGTLTNNNTCKLTATSTYTCSKGRQDGKNCYVSEPAKYACPNGTLSGSTCISRYNICDGEYNNITNYCTENRDYEVRYVCPRNYEVKGSKCVQS